MSKGSRRRPTNAETYNMNYDQIFCQKGRQPQHTITEESTVELLDPYSAYHAWRPANGGTATPFTWEDKEYLHMYNLDTGEHAYFNATDDCFEQQVEIG